MCCLFGFIDYKRGYSVADKSRIVHIMGQEAEERGTDATGIAYLTNRRLTVYKKAVAANRLKFFIPKDAATVMGHTRMATQGSAKNNYNNHPFSGTCGDIAFVLAHNGILFNDVELQKQRHLSPTRIQTDSYVIVQLLEQQPELSPHSLQVVAQELEGNFTFTVMDQRYLYLIKGNNPLCLYHYPGLGVYYYASTKEILDRALAKLKLLKSLHSELSIQEGNILQIDCNSGVIQKYSFNTWKLRNRFFRDFPDNTCLYNSKQSRSHFSETDYRSQLYIVAAMQGIPRWQLELLESFGYELSELEELIYSPIMLESIVNEIVCDEDNGLPW